MANYNIFNHPSNPSAPPTAIKIVNESNGAKYAGDPLKSRMIDSILEKHYNRKVLKSLSKTNRAQNGAYADKYASTKDRLQKKLELRSKN